MSRTTLVVTVLLLGASFGLSPVPGGVTETFADGSPALSLAFPNGGGELTVYVKVPAGSVTLNSTLTVIGDKIPNEKSFVHTTPADFGTGQFYNLTTGLGNLTRDTHACRFSQMVEYPAGSRPHCIAVGDLNGDGRDDVAVTNLGSNSTGIYYQKADGTLDPMVSLPMGGSPYGAAIGDLNGDGRKDLAVAVLRADLSGYVSLFNQTASGTLDPRSDLDAGNFPDGLAMGDLSGDGKADLAVANYLDDSVGVFIQRPAGGFYNMVPYTVGRGARGVAIGDVNNDGRSDLVATVFFDNKTVIHFQTSNGQLQMPPATMDSAYGPVGVAIGDVDSNGRPDIVVANSIGNITGVYFQKPDGTLLNMMNIPGTNAQTYQVAVGDLNDDRRLDIAATNFWPNVNMVDLFAEDIRNSLSTLRNLPTGAGPDGVAITDLNGDGLGDLVVANRRADTIGVFTQLPYTGMFLSAQIPAPLNIVRLNATWNETLNGAPARLEFTNDNGLNWTGAAQGVPLIFGSTGASLRYRVFFRSATGLEELRVNYTLETFFPKDLTLDIGSDGTADWSFPGDLIGAFTLPDFSLKLTAFVLGHGAESDPEGNLSVPLRFTSSSAGLLGLQGISVTFNIPPTVTNYNPKDSPVVLSESDSKTFFVNTTDVEGDPLSYSWSLDGLPQPGTDRIFTYTPDFNSSGNHTLVVNISDGKSSTLQSWMVKVKNINRRPELLDISPAGDPGAREGYSTTFGATARDPDYDALTVEWLVDMIKIRSEGGGAVSYTFRPTYGDAGPHNITLIASDGDLKVSQSWLFNVTAVNPLLEYNLTLPSGDVSVDEGSSQEFSLDVGEVFRIMGNFTIRWHLNGNLVANTASYTLSPDYISSGNQTLTVTVTAGGLRYVRAWKLVVREVTNPPAIRDYLPGDSEVSIKEGDRLEFRVTASDPENDVLTYRWLLTYDGIFNLSVSTANNYTFAANYTSEGKYTVRAVVSDGRTSAVNEWRLTVVHGSKPVKAAPGQDNLLLGIIVVMVIVAVLGVVVVFAWRKRENLSEAFDKVGGTTAAAPAAPSAAKPGKEEAPKPKPKATYPCPSCGQPAEEDWFVCHHCSAPLKGVGDMPAGTARVTSYETRATDEALARAKLSVEALECPKCGKILDPHMENCPTCGEFVRKLEPESAVCAAAGNCPSCGSPYEAEWLKCPECGAQLRQETVAPEAAPAAPPAAAEPAPAGKMAGLCPGCGMPVEAGWKKCPECGTQLN